MERNLNKLGLTNLVILFLIAACATTIAVISGSLAARVALLFEAFGLLVLLVSWFQMRLVERELLEQLEFDELTKRPQDASLFAGAAADTLPARRAREQFERWGVVVFTLLTALGLGAGVWFGWRIVSRPDAVAELKPANLAFAMWVFLGIALILFLFGRYSITLARLENHRLLRPGANALLVNALFSLVVSVGLGLVYFDIPRADLWTARVLLGVAVLVAVELLLTLVFEMYRPRRRGEQARLFYDSRLLGLIATPESLFSTAAQALDYQFGFKVSETWFYQFVRRSLAGLLLAQFGLFVLSTCFVFVEAGEQALLERFGQPVARRPVLGPGLHFKLPFPLDRVHTFRTEQVQSFTLGIVEDPHRAREVTLVWTKSHYQEEYNLLVANRDASATGSQIPPVNLLTVSIPIQFQVTNLLQWAYGHTDPAGLLQGIAYRELVRYLASVDMDEIMSSGREAARGQLRTRIQAAANDQRLGIGIIFVGLQDIHPPVGVAAAYEKVVEAGQVREARILTARAFANQTNAAAHVRATNTLNQAIADRQRVADAALAFAGSFSNRLPAYLASPQVYRTRAYLDTFVRSSASTRKYVLAGTNTSDIIQMNLEDKLRADLLDVQIPTAPARN